MLINKFPDEAVSLLFLQKGLYLSVKGWSPVQRTDGLLHRRVPAWNDARTG